MSGCEQCGRPIVGRKSTARYCTERCHSRARVDRDRARRGLTLPTVLPSINPAFGHWLAGFIDGEGCFLLSGRHDSPTIAFRLLLVVRDDDAEIIHEIHRRTGIGQVITKKGQIRDGAMSSPQVGWKVNRKQDCFALVDLLDRYPLRAKKARDYAIWREAVIEWRESTRAGRNAAAARWARIAELREDLIAGRAYQP